MAAQIGDVGDSWKACGHRVQASPDATSGTLLPLLNAFDELSIAARACRRCPDMEGRTRVLSRANGLPGARVLFVAEAPGRLGAERTGVPMTADQTGKRFTRMLALAGLTRDDVFITNSALCNPRDAEGRNRPPTTTEVRACSPWLRDTIALVDAPVIATLGATALRALALLDPHPYTLRADVGQPRGWGGRILVPLYHPSPRAGLSRSYDQQDEDFRELGPIVCERVVRSE